MRDNKETRLAIALANYINMQYPCCVYHFDLAGMNLSRANALTQARLNHRRGFPDLLIFNEAHGYNGLAIELKAEGTRLTKKDGSWASEHIKEQSEYLDTFSGIQWVAKFCIGFDSAKQLIDWYMAGYLRGVK